MIITNFRNKFKIQSMTKSILMLVTSISMLFAVVFTEGNQARAESEAKRQAKIVHTYKCNDASSFRARFDNTGNFFTTHWFLLFDYFLSLLLILLFQF
jgi:hypothetical protein